MFNKNLKLICTAIGLVAVLVGLMAMPGATQHVEMPTRGQIVKGLSQLIATLTASEGDILDVENTIFGSSSSLKPNPDNITFAYIPLHPSSRSSQLLHDWLFRDEPLGDHLYVGAFYVESDFPGCSGFDPLKAGIYHLKLRSDLKVVAVDSEGNEFVIGHAEKRQQQSLNATFKSTAPITGFWAILIALCAGGDVRICFKRTICQYDENGVARQCETIEVCVEC